MKNPKASLTAEFEDAYGSQSSAVTNESRPKANAKKAKKKRSGDSFWTRMLIFVCGALVGLGVFAGIMYFTKGKDAEAKREKRRSSSSYRTSSSNRSSSGSRGDFYRPSDPMDCSLPGSSVHEIFQARVLEWGAIAFSHIYSQACLNH